MSKKATKRITPILIFTLISTIILVEIFVSNVSVLDSLIKTTLSNSLISIVFIIIIFSLGYQKQLFNKGKITILVVLALLIAINNFPISAFLQGRTTVEYPMIYSILFFLESLSTGLYEELFFRGLLFIVLLEVLKDHSYKTIKAILISSFLFGILHFVNILGGASTGFVLQQIGYSFLLGILWATIFVQTKNILFPIFLHGIYNFCGLYFQTVGEVNYRWDTVTLIVTVLLSSITAYFVFIELYKQTEVKQ